MEIVLFLTLIAVTSAFQLFLLKKPDLTDRLISSKTYNFMHQRILPFRTRSIVKFLVDSSKTCSINTLRRSYIFFRSLTSSTSIYQNKRFYSRSTTMEAAAVNSTPTPVPSDPATLVHNLEVVRDRINRCTESKGKAPDSVRLVAVSKTKAKEDILALYEAGHRHFGENYFQELVDKAKSLPKDICWHFIGHLQSQKASKLIREIPQLYLLETVDSVKLASKLHNAILSSRDGGSNKKKGSNCSGSDSETEAIAKADGESGAAESVNVDQRFKIYIQINTSNEDTKSGITNESELFPLVDYIKTECAATLEIRGLMTIGAPDDFTCFTKLVELRDRLAEYLKVPTDTLEVSMGMSGDFEEAIAHGSTSVRIGSTIFGARLYPNRK